MKMFKRILVATDLGAASDEALRIAVIMATTQGATLAILHVITDRSLALRAMGEADDAITEIIGELDRRARQAIAARLSSLGPRRPNLAVDVLIGSPAAAIVRYAADSGIDLIVVGSHGRGPLPRLLLGSVAEQVLRRATCPVLVVRPRATHATASSAA
jgi:universal stress protein A